MSSVWTWAEQGALRDALRDAMDRAPGTMSLSAYIRLTPYLERSMYLQAIWPIIKEAIESGEVHGAGDHRRAGDQAIDLVG